MKKFKNLFILSVLCCCILGGFTIAGCTDSAGSEEHTSNEWITEGNFSFKELDDGTYSVKAADKNISGDLVIPSTYGGKRVTEIEDLAFRECIKLTSVTIPNSITKIPYAAFWDCDNLENVSIPEGVTEIGYRSFNGCGKLKDLEIPNSVQIIREEAFYSCGSLEYISIPNNVTSIGYTAFRYCRALKSVSIPLSVTNIGKQAFEYCSGLESFTYEGTTEQWKQITVGSKAIPSSVTVVCTDV